VFVQRVVAAGTLAWAAPARLGGASPGSTNNPMVLTDEAGGAYVFWIRSDSPMSPKSIRGAHVGANGALAGGSTADGLVVASDRPSISPRFLAIPDGAHGAYVGWSAVTDPGAPTRVRIARVGADGGALATTPETAGTTDAPAGPQYLADLQRTRFGPLVLWEAYDASGSTSDLDAQLFDDTLQPQFGAFGRALVNDPGSQRTAPGHCLVVGGPVLEIFEGLPTFFTEDGRAPLGQTYYRVATSDGDRLFLVWSDDRPGRMEPTSESDPFMRVADVRCFELRTMGVRFPDLPRILPGTSSPPAPVPAPPGCRY
jgi:hypothetical protein